MEKSIKRQHPAEFKLQVVLALMKQEKTMSQICSEFRIHSSTGNITNTSYLKYLSG